MKRLRGRRDGADRGAAGAEVLALGVLVFIGGTLLVLSAWRVVDAKFATSAAAREATRTFVEHVGSSASARAEAAAAARDAVAAHGLDAGRIAEVAITGALERCARVHTRVTYRVPPMVLPWTRDIATVEVVGAHTEVVDPLRSTVPGEAGCLG